MLGRRRDAARKRIGEPNVTERVARGAPCSVLVVPEGTSGPIEHVVAADETPRGSLGSVARDALNRSPFPVLLVEDAHRGAEPDPALPGAAR